ncbi:putative siderophore-binding lipoprotein YfiY precursor [compost metagenome]
MKKLQKRHAGKWSICLMIMMVFAVVLTACGGAQNKENASSNVAQEEQTKADNQVNEQTATEKVVTDAMGHEVTIPANPQRIIATYLEDPLLVLGYKPVAQWSVANGIQDYLQDQLTGIPTISYDLPPETVASFNPDLILITSEATVQNGLYEQYSKIAPTYVVGDAISADWRKTLSTMGELLNATDKADAAIKEYEQKVADTKAKVEAKIGDNKAAIIWLVSKNFYVVNGEVASGAVLYGDLGIKTPDVLAVLPEATANWNPISLEKLVELDADYIFLVNSDKGQAGNLEDALWKNIPAVKNGNVFELDSTSSWLYNGQIAGTKIMDDLVRLIESK